MYKSKYLITLQLFSLSIALILLNPLQILSQRSKDVFIYKGEYEDRFNGIKKAKLKRISDTAYYEICVVYYKGDNWRAVQDIKTKGNLEASGLRMDGENIIWVNELKFIRRGFAVKD